MSFESTLNLCKIRNVQTTENTETGVFEKKEEFVARVIAVASILKPCSLRIAEGVKEGKTKVFLPLPIFPLVSAEEEFLLDEKN